MAVLSSRPKWDAGALWASTLWRCAGVCVAFVLILSALTFVLPVKRTSNDLTQDFEKTMLSAVDQDGDSVW